MLARQARAGEPRQVRLELMRPTNFMLAEPMADAGRDRLATSRRRSTRRYKYDGVRAQLHKKGDEVRIFSRRLEEITASFPELVEGARADRPRPADRRGDSPVQGREAALLPAPAEEAQEDRGLRGGAEPGARWSTSASTSCCSTARSSTGGPSRRGEDALARVIERARASGWPR